MKHPRFQDISGFDDWKKGLVWGLIFAIFSNSVIILSRFVGKLRLFVNFHNPSLLECHKLSAVFNYFDWFKA